MPWFIMPLLQYIRESGKHLNCLFGYDRVKLMDDFKSRPGTFLPFLEYSQKTESPPSSAPASALTLLEILSRRPQKSPPIFDQKILGRMDPSRYASALKSLRDANFIEIAGEAPGQLVALSDSGAAVARVARPA